MLPLKDLATKDLATKDLATKDLATIVTQPPAYQRHVEILLAGPPGSG
jgi:hypothetical protein